VGRRTIFTAVLISALAAAGAGCGGDDEAAGGGAQEITVTADEYSFELSDTPAAGPATFTLDNVGEERHELIVAQLASDASADDAIRAQGREGTTELVRRVVAKPGEQSERAVEVELESANYLLLCTFSTKGEPHFTLGQREELEITGD
jgi:hypothetical protein